jgi:hypothetical protein
MVVVGECLPGGQAQTDSEEEEVRLREGGEAGMPQREATRRPGRTACLTEKVVGVAEVVAGEGEKAVVRDAEEENQSRRSSKLLMVVVGGRLPEGQAQSDSEEEEVRLPEQGEAGMQ